MIAYQTKGRRKVHSYLCSTITASLQRFRPLASPSVIKDCNGAPGSRRRARVHEENVVRFPTQSTKTSLTIHSLERRKKVGDLQENVEHLWDSQVVLTKAKEELEVTVGHLECTVCY